MIIYNRKKKAEYYAEQKAIAIAALHSAEEALAAGTATEEQLQILIRENRIPSPSSINSGSQPTIGEQTDFGKAQAAANQAASTIAKETKGVWATAKSWVFAGLKNEDDAEDPTETFGYEGTSEDDDVMGERSSDIARAVAAKKAELEFKAKQALEKEVARERGGGPLDRLGTEEEGVAGLRTEKADAAVGKESGGGSGWTSFMTRK